MERRRGVAAIGRADPHVDVVDILLRVLDRDVEIAVRVERPGIRELVFRLVAAAAAPLLDEVGIRVGGLGIAVEQFQVGVARHGIGVEVDLLDVLSVVALLVGQAEQTLLEDAVASVPECQRQAHQSAVVADPRDAVLAPPVGAGSSVLVRQEAPGIAVAAVILADRAPLALAEIRTPERPGLLAPRRLRDAASLGPPVDLAGFVAEAAHGGPRSALPISFSLMSSRRLTFPAAPCIIDATRCSRGEPRPAHEPASTAGRAIV